jgi:hypothetical protein
MFNKNFPVLASACLSLGLGLISLSSYAGGSDFLVQTYCKDWQNSSQSAIYGASVRVYVQNGRSIEDISSQANFNLKVSGAAALVKLDDGTGQNAPFAMLRSNWKKAIKKDCDALSASPANDGNPFVTVEADLSPNWLGELKAGDKACGCLTTGGGTPSPACFTSYEFHARYEATGEEFSVPAGAPHFSVPTRADHVSCSAP